METLDVNLLVRKILADISGDTMPVVVRPEIPKNPKQEDNDGVLRLTQKVVSVADLANSWGKFRKLVVPKNAILTPSVKDELRKRGVEYSMDDAARENTPSSTDFSVWIAWHKIKQQPTGLLEQIKKQHSTHEYKFDCILETMKAASDALHIGGDVMLAVVLSGYTAAAICVANRHENIRAVAGHDVMVLKNDAIQIGANMLVVDPGKMGKFKTKELVKTFLDGGVRPIPEFLAAKVTP